MAGHGGDPYFHYAMFACRRLPSPAPVFSAIRYLLLNQAALLDRTIPLCHYEEFGRGVPGVTAAMLDENMPVVAPDFTYRKRRRFRALQDRRIRKEYSRDTEKLVVYLLPDFDQICGGMMCICNYAHDIRELPEIEGHAVMLATIPSYNTFPDYTKFDARAHVYRFQQIRKHFRRLRRLVLHIPEYQWDNLLFSMTAEEWAWLASLPELQINLMNQNAELMPLPTHVELLRTALPNASMTMTCAHRQYCDAAMRSTYSMPLHFIPAEKKLVFNKLPYAKKRNLLLTSPDEHPLRTQVFEVIRNRFPDLEIVLVANMPFATYLRLLGEAKWVVSFGEGMDGYTVESLYSDTISFTAHNETFFDATRPRWPNVYASYSEMANRLVDDMIRLDHPVAYREFLEHAQKACFSDRADLDYDGSLATYYRGEYSLPFEETERNRAARLRERPPVSVVMTTRNNASFLPLLLTCLRKQDYPGLEFVITDNASDDNTWDLLRAFAKKPPPNTRVSLKRVERRQTYNRCFHESLCRSRGDFIALAEPDDVWRHDKITRLVEGIDDFDLAFDYATIIDPEGRHLPDHSLQRLSAANLPRRYRLRDLLFENPVPMGSSLVRRTLLGDGRDDFFNQEDAPFFWGVMFKALLAGQGAVAVGRNLTRSRFNPRKYELVRITAMDWNQRRRCFIANIRELYAAHCDASQKEQFARALNWLSLYSALQPHMAGLLDVFMNNNRFSFSSGLMKELKDCQCGEFPGARVDRTDREQ